jgi:hypothetical protein
MRIAISEELRSSMNKEWLDADWLYPLEIKAEESLENLCLLDCFNP